MGCHADRHTQGDELSTVAFVFHMRCKCERLALSHCLLGRGQPGAGMSKHKANQLRNLNTCSLLRIRATSTRLYMRCPCFSIVKMEAPDCSLHGVSSQKAVIYNHAFLITLQSYWVRIATWTPAVSRSGHDRFLSHTFPIHCSPVILPSHAV
jgi:hypothetical protein